MAEFDWSLVPGPSAAPALRSDAARSLAANAMADALPLFEALARETSETLRLPLGETLSLQVALRHAA